MKKILFTLLLVLGISAAADAQVRFLDSSTDAVRKEAIAQDKLVFIDLYATWCGPCKALAPVLEELAAEYGDRIYIYKINTEEEQELAAAFGIRSIPTLLFIPASGKPQIAQGALPKASLKEAIDQVLLNK